MVRGFAETHDGNREAIQMRKRWLRVAVTVIGVVALSAATTPGDLQDCIDQCIADFEQDRQQCLQEFQQCLATVAQEFQDCIDEHGGDPVGEFQCFQQSNIGQENCESDADRCQARANTDGYDCYRTCQASYNNP
jgi:hypothetical protein